MTPVRGSAYHATFDSLAATIRGHMMSGSKRRWITLTILAVALGLRVVGAIWWQQHLGSARVFGLPDSDGYWDLGQRIATGRAYEYGGPTVSGRWRWQCQ